MNTTTKIIILSGIPGSGKSTFAQKYYDENNTKEKIAIVSSDELRKTHLGRYDDFNHETLIWFKYFKAIKEASKTHDVVICDACNISETQWDNYLELNCSELYLYRFITPYEICLARQSSRGKERNTPELAMQNYRRKFQNYPPQLYPHFKKVILIDGTK